MEETLLRRSFQKSHHPPSHGLGFATLANPTPYKMYADVSHLEREFGYRPATLVEEGIREFVDWYMGFYL